MSENEIIYQPESSLPTSDVSQLAHIRALNSVGESVNATPSSVRELVGIDYSLLTEQIVPGEFWVDAQGNRKQVYVKTGIISAYPNSEGYFVVTMTYGATNLLSYEAFYDIDGSGEIKHFLSLAEPELNRGFSFRLHKNEERISFAVNKTPEGSERKWTIWYKIKYTK